MPYTVKVVTPPATRPVTAQEVKQQVGTDPDIGNPYIETVIDAVTRVCERYTRRAFITQTHELILDRFPRRERAEYPWWLDTVFNFADAVRIPYPQLQSVDSVTTFDYANQTSTLSADAYFVNTRSEPGTIVPTQLNTWPTEVLPEAGVVIRYTAGYGDDAEDVPAPLRAAIILEAAHYVSQQDPGIVSESIDNASITYGGWEDQLLPQVKSALHAYRVPKV